MVTSGLRLGTPAVTTRGMKEGDMQTIADLIDRVLTSGGDEGAAEAVRGDVLKLCQKHEVPA
jgi:glycine hydroxymethyltransferase